MTLEYERRHDADPHPPEGLGERRHCSDKECMEARNRWFLSELLPQLTNRFWIGVVATVLTLASANYFIMQAMLDRHELSMFEVFERSITHDEDIIELKEDMKTLSGSVSQSVATILVNQERILSEIRSGKGK